jgi:transposase-like protein
MVKEVLQAGLDVEMSDHLGYEPYEIAGHNTGSSRNGSYEKTVTTDVGSVELQMLRDWQGTFDLVYPVLLIDAIVIKVRGSQVANRPVYVAIGVNLEGERDVLGLWLGPSDGEGARHWVTMLTELKNRGIRDALIVCCDGLKGLPNEIRATWPDATVQTCVVHLIRNSLRYASKQHWQKTTRQLRPIYTAPTVQAAEEYFREFSAEWGDCYPDIIKSWENSWPEFVPFLEFPVELRKIVYTTNSIESLNAKFRRATRHRGHFPTEQAAMKVLYLLATQQRKNRIDLVGKTHGWKTILNARVC